MVRRHSLENDSVMSPPRQNPAGRARPISAQVKPKNTIITRSNSADKLLQVTSARLVPAQRPPSAKTIHRPARKPVPNPNQSRSPFESYAQTHGTISKSSLKSLQSRVW